MKMGHRCATIVCDMGVQCLVCVCGGLGVEGGVRTLCSDVCDGGEGEVRRGRNTSGRRVTGSVGPRGRTGDGIRQGMWFVRWTWGGANGASGTVRRDSVVPGSRFRVMG